MSFPPRFIPEVMPYVCKAAADAVCRYATVSNEIPWDDMPEAFVCSTVFDSFAKQFGRTFSLTMETSLKKLWDWNNSARQRMGRPILNRSDPSVMERFSALAKKRAKSPRIDLVIYHGDEQDPSRHDFLAMVEFKRYRPSDKDRDKVLDILALIDTCPVGAICGVIQTHPASTLVKEQSQAKKAAEKWFEHPVPKLPPHMPEYTVVARAFPRRP